MTNTRAAVLAATMLISPAAMAQDFPTQPIRLLVPFAPGGTTDVMARLVANAMSEDLGQNVLVENVGGAGGRIGTEQVIRSEPDGYTLLFANMGPMAASMSIFDDQTYDPRTDLAPVGLVAEVPMVLAASNASGITSLEQFMEKLRTEGEAVNFGTAGFGATTDLAPALLLFQTGLEATRIPYQGAGPAIVDLQAGMIDAVIDQTPTLVPAHLSDQVTALAVTGDERLSQLPDLPTFTEAGVPEFNMTVWNAIAAPVGTPEPIIERIAASMDAAFDDPTLQERFSQLAIPIPPEERRGPEPLDQLIDTEVDRWMEIFAGQEAPAAN